MVAEFRGLQVAAKCLHSTIISNHNRQLFMREMNISAKLRHPNLVQFIGATVEGKPVILTELMTASLRGILEQGPFQLQQITSISCNVALALNYMHLLHPDPILHRDVSSANILLNQGPGDTWVAKLSDCGSANFTRLVNTVGPGNPSYAAPEAANPSQQSPKMDVYSFGVTLMEMIINQFPDRDHLAAQVRLVTEPRLLQLIQRCIDDNPARRPAIRDVLTELLL
jgi:serine/threonine protein kinase